MSNGDCQRDLHMQIGQHLTGNTHQQPVARSGHTRSDAESRTPQESEAAWDPSGTTPRHVLISITGHGTSGNKVYFYQKTTRTSVSYDGSLDPTCPSFPLKVRHSIKTISSSPGTDAYAISACQSSALSPHPQWHKKGGEGTWCFCKFSLSMEFIGKDVIRNGKF